MPASEEVGVGPRGEYASPKRNAQHLEYVL